jgi:mono/diheme cytochrome c family protein
MKIVKRILLSLVVLIAVVAVIVKVSFTSKANRIFAKPDIQIHEDVLKADLKIGERIFMVRNGCVDCHGKDLSGAKIMEDPAMGTIYGANITPYKLKDWSDEDIARAIRYGIHKEGRSLRFMPSFDFEGLSKGDVAAVIKFIRSVPSVEKESHENSYGPLAHVLAVAGQMPVMFPALVVDPTKGFSEKPSEEATLAFGKYLANSCVGCHGSEFKGGKIPGGDPSWPAAADIRLGGSPVWTEESFTNLIKSGKSPVDGRELRAPMPVNLLKQMNETEVKALWLFLSSISKT